MKNALRILFLIMILGGFIFIGNADAAQFTGDAWFAQHYTGVNEPTNEYFLIIADPTIQSAQLKGFVLKSHGGLDFSDLKTASTGNSGLVWWKMDLDNSRVYLKALKKGEKKYGKYEKKMQKRGKERDTKSTWIENYVSNKLASRKIRGTVTNVDEIEFKLSGVPFATFQNPPETETPGNGGTSPVPEPAAMLLLGSGLVVIAAAGRKKLLKK